MVNLMLDDLCGETGETLLLRFEFYILILYFNPSIAFGRTFSQQ